MKKKIFASILGVALSLQAVSVEANAIDEQIQAAQNDIVVSIRGDVNSDGEFNIADVVLFQKWLLGNDVKLKNWKAADLCEDNCLNVYDLCMMKRILLENQTDYSKAYIDICQSAESDGVNYTYNLIDIDGNDVPELVVDNSGYYLSLYTFANGEVKTLMDKRGYNVSGNVGYEYIPSENYIHFNNNENGGLIRYDSYVKIDENLDLTRIVTIKSVYDKSAVTYLIDDEEISAEVFESYKRTTYSHINGIFNYDEILSELLG